MVDVPHIQGELLLPGEGVAPIHLRPAGDAGEHLVAACLLGSIAFEVGDEQGARTHQAHLSLEDIDEFRQFIQAGGAQEAPETGKALPVGQRVALMVKRVAHAAELVEFEDAAVQPGSRLAEDDWPTEEDPHQQEQKNQNWRKDKQCHGTDKYIHNPF